MGIGGHVPPLLDFLVLHPAIPVGATAVSEPTTDGLLFALGAVGLATFRQQRSRTA